MQENEDTGNHFKTNFLDFLTDLIQQMENKQEVQTSLETVVEIVKSVDGKMLVTLFLDQVETKIKEDNRPESEWKTIREEYNAGKYYKVFREFINTNSLAKTLKFENQIAIEEFDDDTKEIYIEYLKSFFKISSNFKKSIIFFQK